MSAERDIPAEKRVVFKLTPYILGMLVDWLTHHDYDDMDELVFPEALITGADGSVPECKLNVMASRTGPGTKWDCLALVDYDGDEDGAVFQRPLARNDECLLAIRLMLSPLNAGLYGHDVYLRTGKVTIQAFDEGRVVRE